MTEPPRPPGAGDADGRPPEPTVPLAPGSPPPPPEPPTTNFAAPDWDPPTRQYGPPDYEPPTQQYGTPEYEPPTQQYGPPGHEPPTEQYAPPGHEPPTQRYGTPEYEPPAQQYGPPGYPPPAGDQGGYPPDGGFPPPGPGQPPTGGPSATTSGDDRIWALLAHAGGPVGVVVGGSLFGWVGPLIVLLVRGQQSPAVRAHAVAALNFQLTWALAILIGWLLTAVTCGLLFFVPLLIALVPIVLGVVGALKANEGVLYPYPASRAFVR
ncbi:DUF4870 domain-containing protein [Micromonospora sp. WMMD882]|uniref:DUF4870 domain-containing protein n=1 Tax=Micromonospora sp. WMMD882 TaxID=3015151 RepID=UPI00248C6354|nr:DUF4870 domain-containing protein [Micromonospora sp. WMMD882]WBB79677.1 DUF4870 domain-containing protein [Micromonospora sp. WMMD882]